MKQVKLSDTTHNELLEISDNRKVLRHPTRTQQDIIADLVAKAYKREFKSI